MPTIAETIVTKQQAYQAKTARIQAIAAGQLDETLLAEMRTLNAELEPLGGEITELRALVSGAESAGRNAGTAPFRMEMQGATNERANEESARTGGARVEAFTRSEGDGTLHIYEQNGQRIHEYDGFVIPEKTFLAINEKSYDRAFRIYLAKGGKVADLDGFDRRLLEVGDDGAGGFLVPADYQRRILERKPGVTKLRDNVSIITTGSDNVIIPQVVYEASDKDQYPNGVRVTWSGEVPSSSTVHRTATPQFGQVQIPVNTAMMSHPLTLNMVEDSFTDITGWLCDKFQTAVQLTEEAEIISGPGTSGRIQGILATVGATGGVQQIVSGNASALTADGIMDLAYSLPAQYDDDAHFYMNKTSTARQISKIKDNDARYMFATGNNDDRLASARPKELVGYGYSYSSFMPDVAANANPLLFGNAKGYSLVRRVGFSIKILTEVYYEQNQLVAVGRLRIGGKLTEPWMMLGQKVST